jgi:hypothetical protein
MHVSCRWFIAASVGVLASCSDDGKLFLATDIDLQQQAILHLSIVQSAGSESVEACASWLRSTEKTAWIGGYEQTWWRLTAKQELRVNGVKLTLGAKQQRLNDFYQPKHYCAVLPASERYQLRWQDSARSQLAEQTVAGFAPLQPCLRRQGNGDVLLHWQGSSNSTQLYIRVLATAPPSEPRGAAQVSGNEPLRLLLENDAEQVTVRFMMRQLHNESLLGFISPHNQWNLFRETDVTLIVPPLAP